MALASRVMNRLKLEDKRVGNGVTILASTREEEIASHRAEIEQLR